jgi:superfamily II DNA helicase RecQ
MILTNPETALSPRVLPRLKELNIRHLVIDEMHTVSEWGETFRPTYLEIGRLAPEAGIPLVTAFTATASPFILEKVKNIIFPDTSPNIITANPDRPNIHYRVIPCLSKNHELVKLLEGGRHQGRKLSTWAKHNPLCSARLSSSAGAAPGRGALCDLCLRHTICSLYVALLAPITPKSL